MTDLRLFVALEFSPANRQALGGLTGRLSAAAPGRAVNWVRPELMHLTLKFLGDTPETALPSLSAALSTLAAAQPAFTLTTGRLGAFPNLKRPRVLWLGLESQPAGALTALARGVEAALTALGAPREDKPFSPHLTLGRVRREAGPDEAARAGAALAAAGDPPRLTQPAAEVLLMRSVLGRSGPTYSILGRAALAA